jgi:hypothetical protein
MEPVPAFSRQVGSSRNDNNLVSLKHPAYAAIYFFICSFVLIQKNQKIKATKNQLKINFTSLKENNSSDFASLSPRQTDFLSSRSVQLFSLR